MAAEIYPMPSFVTLQTADTATSSRWYQDVLGFEHVFTMGSPDQPMMTHLRWTKYADVLLVPGAPEGIRGAGVTLTFAVTDGTVDALADRARARGAVLMTEPGNRPWNARDFSVADPEGYRLTFTWGPVDAALDFAAATRSAG